MGSSWHSKAPSVPAQPSSMGMQGLKKRLGLPAAAGLAIPSGRGKMTVAGKADLPLCREHGLGLWDV